MESEHLLGHARLGHARLGNACFGTKYKNSAAGFHSAAEFSAAEVYSSLWQIPLGFLQRSRTCGHMAAASASCSSELLRLYEGIFGLEEAAALEPNRARAAAPGALVPNRARAAAPGALVPNRASAAERMAWARAHGFSWTDRSILKPGRNRGREEPPACDCHWARPQNQAMMYECAEAPRCSNRQLQLLAEDPQRGVDVEIFDTGGGKGWGVRALRDFQPGELIIEYVGRVLLKKELFENPEASKNYLMRADEVVIDASEHGNAARFMNHSCSPSAIVEVWKIPTLDGLSLRTAVGIFAQGFMRAGSEITYDYKFERFEDAVPTPCLCGAPNCRLFM